MARKKKDRRRKIDRFEESLGDQPHIWLLEHHESCRLEYRFYRCNDTCEKKSPEWLSIKLKNNTMDLESVSLLLI